MFLFIPRHGAIGSPGILLPFLAGTEFTDGSLLAEPFQCPQMGILMTISMYFSTFHISPLSIFLLSCFLVSHNGLQLSPTRCLYLYLELEKSRIKFVLVPISLWEGPPSILKEAGFCVVFVIFCKRTPSAISIFQLPLLGCPVVVNIQLC